MFFLRPYGNRLSESMDTVILMLYIVAVGEEAKFVYVHVDRRAD